MSPTLSNQVAHDTCKHANARITLTGFRKDRLKESGIHFQNMNLPVPDQIGQKGFWETSKALPGRFKY